MNEEFNLSNYRPNGLFGSYNFGMPELQNISSVSGAAGGGSGSGFGNALGMTSQGISAVGELFNIWQSRKNYKLAKDAFKFNKQLSTINLNNQAKLTNERLETRQNTRRADNPNAEDTSSFMAKYKVSGIGG